MPRRSAATCHFPVNGDRSFTGNCGSFAEYRVRTGRIALKITPSKENLNAHQRR